MSPAISVPSFATLMSTPSSDARVAPNASCDGSFLLRIFCSCCPSIEMRSPPAERATTGRPVTRTVALTTRSRTPPAPISATFVKPDLSASQPCSRSPCAKSTAASTKLSPAAPRPVASEVPRTIAVLIRAALAERSAVTVLAKTSEPANFAAPAAPIGTRLSQSPRAPASVNGLMLWLCSQREPISSADFVMLEPIAVSIISPPAKFSAPPANTPTPVASSSTPAPSISSPRPIIPRFTLPPVSVFSALSNQSS
ncbi:hypothetical protein IST4112_06594 [Burkholderia cenocepacia]|nr:hypothetical protein IST4112_06594 [Burkholderia cenocepacia]